MAQLEILRGFLSIYTRRSRLVRSLATLTPCLADSLIPACSVSSQSERHRAHGANYYSAALPIPVHSSVLGNQPLVGIWGSLELICRSYGKSRHPSRPTFAQSQTDAGTFLSTFLEFGSQPLSRCSSHCFRLIELPSFRIYPLEVLADFMGNRTSSRV